MKYLILILTLFSCSISFSQKNHFIRLFDSKDHKFAKGKLQEVTDSTLLISVASADSVQQIHFSGIDKIRLKRAAGHSIFLTTLSGGLIGAAIGLSQGDDPTQGWVVLHFTATEKAGMIAVPGMIGGAVIGCGYSIIKGEKIIQVNGDPYNWKMASKQLKEWLKE